MSGKAHRSSPPRSAPNRQSIAAACEELRASLNGPCRFHPEFNPKPLNTRFYPREITVR
jgi:hypothetical protein